MLPEPHIMELPRRVIVGTGLIDRLGTFLKDLEIGSKVLVVSGPLVRDLLESKLTRSLHGENIDVKWESVFSSNLDEVQKISTLSKSLGVSFLIGVGGGKSIDIAKLASFNNKLPFVSIPTSASHDGISSPFASVKGLDRPYSFVAKPPIAIVADVDIISRAPRKLINSGCGDLISKKTAVKDWQLSSKKTGEYLGTYSAGLALLSANIIEENALKISEGGIEGVRVVVEALISAGVAAGIAGSSRPCSGSEHLFSHAMDIVAPGRGLHGEKCGIGTIMMARLHGIDAEGIRKSLETIGSPTRAKQIGADEEDIARALVLARTIRKERYTILNETKLNPETAKELARSVGVL